jgi:hypothetical protein
MAEIWTEHEIGVGESALFRLGMLRLHAARGEHDWSLAWRWASDAVVGGPDLAEGPGEDALRRSFAFPHSQGPLRLSPVLADRPVIVRPAQDITVAPQALVQLYVTTSLWVNVAAEGGAEPLLELPCVQPKETWFGPSTMEGERCYAGRLPLRPHHEALAGIAHRAITPLLIRNRSAEPLPVLRARLPVPRLTLFRARDGGFWTSRVSVLRREGSDDVEVEVLPRAPDEAGQAAQVASARDRAAAGVVSRALGSVFSHSFIP